ncbi:MAG: AAA family ATPase [Bacteroidota bacterium]|nr:AAA family ATPase [Bacteroidota bacterium]
MANYKFKSIQTYSSDEWMSGSTKKYRNVFERDEVNYLRVEFAFFNKLFDENDWNCKVELKAFDITLPNEKKELCNLDSQKTISKDENIFYLRDGWGNKEYGTYWKKGKYLWEAYIDGVLAGSHEFFINEIGLVTKTQNPYFSVEYLKLYPGGYEGWETPKDKRKYLTKINRNTTQYLWVEFRIKNLSNLEYNYELFFNFYDDAGQKKGQVTREGKIEPGKPEFTYTFDAGWGNETAGSWKDDKYTVEVIFMDTLIAAVTFESGEEDVEGIPELISTIEQTISATGATTKTGTTGTSKGNEEETKTLEDLLTELDALIGLDSVKKSIRENIDYLKFAKLRQEKGFKDSSKISLHSIFTGNPGTGKTTVVKMLGKIYQKMGLLSKGHVHEVDRTALVGEFIGQTAPRTKKAIEEARGGILFIDEAYSLARSGEDSKDFGKEVIEVLLKEMSDGKGDIAIIGAGYPKEMEDFINSNPGLKSRFSHYFHFDDYLPEELYAIAVYAAKNKEVKLMADADNFLKEQLIEAYRKRDDSFGNARFVHGIVEEAKMNMGIRLMKLPNINDLSKEDFEIITLEDLRPIFAANERKKLKLAVNDKHLQEAMSELNELVGMDNIKQEVNELVKLVRFYNDIGKDVMNKFSLHSIFTGNPGTGKTTLARIIGKIYKALGLLERGHVVEVDREGLLAGYVGQTAIKTADRIDEAMGGILFIDEAYALSDGMDKNNFGQEAIEVILKRMEDQRGKFGVIAAGYPDNMSKFVEANPGLKSRFDKTFHFYDYLPEQMMLISKFMLHKEGLKANEEAEEHMLEYFTNLYEQRDKFFGNARSVRQMVVEAVKNQNLRMASLEAAGRTPKELETLKLEDVSEFVFEKVETQKPSLGFRFHQA